MSLEQQVTALVEASNNLTSAVNGKIGQIDQRMTQAENEFDAFKADADNRYLNVVSATEANHKLKNVYFGNWETDKTDISPTSGYNALILSKKVDLSVDPAVRGDMAMIGTINALRIHSSKGLAITRFIINYCESWTGRTMSLISDELNALGDWEIREVMLPSLDASTPFYVLSRSANLDVNPNSVAFLGKMTFDGIYGHTSKGQYGNIGQYEYTGTPIILADCGYTKPGA
ncbi:hypothetical protein R1W15_004281 [Vibrio fluvialis]|nr:hypothetical protein [Vibrio fluvialis]